MSNIKKSIYKVLAWTALLVVFVYPIVPTLAAPEKPVSPTVPIYNQIQPDVPAIPTAPGADPAGVEAKTIVADPALSETSVSAESAVPYEGGQSVSTGLENVFSPLLAEQSNMGEQNNLSGVNDTTKGTDSSSETSITNENDAKVDNTVKLSADSGGNQSSYNTGNGSVTTGDSNVVLSILNMINTVFMAPEGSQIGLVMSNIIGNLIGDYIFGPLGELYSLTGSRLDVGNNNTGPGFTNSALVNVGNETIIKNINDAIVGNNIGISANTGGNESSYNTGNGSVSTGDANVSLNLLNLLNSTFYAENQGLFGILNIFGNLVGNLVIPRALATSNGAGTGSMDIVVGNENTGADSINNAGVNISNNLDIDNNNTADLANDIAVAGNAGDNSSSYNTGDGAVTSGNVNADLNVSNTANQNIVGDGIFYAIINVLGDWTGINQLASIFKTYVLPNPDGKGQTILVTNADTGANSENNAGVNVSNDMSIKNTNNAVVDNNISIDASTGNNSSSYNTGSGNVQSGDVNLLANVLNMANLNVVAKKFTFYMVNIFGDWQGDVADHGVETTVFGTTNTSDNSEAYVVSSESTPGVTTVVTRVPNTSSIWHIFTPGQNMKLASTLEPSEVEVLGVSSNDPTLFNKNQSSNDNAMVRFMKQNVWNILIVLGIIMLTWSAYLYERQRNSRINNFL